MKDFVLFVSVIKYPDNSSTAQNSRRQKLKTATSQSQARAESN